jgi:hypothetical protein
MALKPGSRRYGAKRGSPIRTRWCASSKTLSQCRTNGPEKVLPDKRAEIVIYCINEECEAPKEEARELVERGYVNVLYYAGREAGLDQGRPLHGGGRHYAQGSKPASRCPRRI